VLLFFRSTNTLVIFSLEYRDDNNDDYHNLDFRPCRLQLIAVALGFPRYISSA
jgi:hypothetical protein